MVIDIIVTLYVLCMISSIIIYFRGHKYFKKYGSYKGIQNHTRAIKHFKLSYIILITGFAFLTLALIIRIFS